MIEREHDEDERREAIDQRRAMRGHGCACGLDGFPGFCPGRDACPYADRAVTCEDDGDE